jgi:hypothetical protein
MTALGRARPALGLTSVLTVYWVPAIIALRWGIWAGGDLRSVLGAVRDQYWNGLSSVPLSTLPAIPIVLVATLTALWALRRRQSTGVTDARDVVTLALGVPYLLLALFYGIALLLFFVVCSVRGCSIF